MFNFRIIFLLFVSAVLLSCGRPPMHAGFSKGANSMGDSSQLRKFIPEFGRGLYQTSVDVVGNHLSGLLLIKKMPDSATRILFTNEMGVSYFDFEFAKDGRFIVHSIIKKMNKPAVKKTLKNDFQLVLMNQVGYQQPELRYHNGQLYHIFKVGKGYYYYITDSLQQQLLEMERASAKKVVVKAHMLNFNDGIPDSIGISHTGFEFNISLKRIRDEETAE